MIIMDSILLRYHELAMKGQNRHRLEDLLGRNIQKMIHKNLGVTRSVQWNRIRGRIILDTPWDLATRDTLSQVFGISSFSVMQKVRTEKTSILQAAFDAFAHFVHENGMPQTFRIKSRRSDKVFSETSLELDCWLGEAIRDRYPEIKVDLENPDYTLGLEVRKEESFIWSEKYSGQAGLPVGTNGRVLCLMSGGIDSPVAAIQTLKRGSSVEFIYFHGAPFVGTEALEKVEDLVRIVNRYQPDPQPLHVIAFGKIQEKIAAVTNSKMRTVLYRRMMIRIACALAKKRASLALITGESLGQVASQTLENIAAIDAVASVPILRPLITYDKDQIIELAHRFKTFSTSVKPAIDSCTLFADHSPVLRTTPQLIQAQESRYPYAEWVNEAVEQCRELS